MAITPAFQAGDVGSIPIIRLKLLSKISSFFLLKSILYNIISMMQSEYNSKYMARSTANLIAPAVEYIKKNYTNESICISELSAMCDISEDYLRKIYNYSFSTLCGGSDICSGL